MGVTLVWYTFTLGIKTTHKPKLSIFAHRGDSLHQFTWNLAWPRETWVCLSKKISRQSVKEVGTRPPKVENFHFLVESCHAGANPYTYI